MQSALRVLLILQCLAMFASADISDKQLQEWVDRSTLTFTGTIVEMGESNVSGINSKDFPMIVRVEKIESGDEQGLKKFGSLKGTQLTVIVDSTPRNGLRNNVAAVFFADPLVYETNIGVVANAIDVVDEKSAEDFTERLHAAALRKSEAPLRKEVASAELIITGEVITVGPLASNKAVDLASVKNGWEISSEHRPRWMEAVIKVRSIEKPKPPRPAFVTVVFPAAHDCWANSPKFETKQSGIWLLHRNQLDQQEKAVLLKSEKSNHGEIQSYTALAPADFQDLANLDRIQKIIAETK